MLRTSIAYSLVRSFPECAVMILIGCYFLNINISLKTLLKKTLNLGIIISLIRMLPISFGIHTFLMMGCVLFILVKLSKNNFIDCILALCKIFLCLVLSEVIYIKILTEIFNIPETEFMYNYTLKSGIYTLPSLIVFIILAIILKVILKKINKGDIIKDNAKFN